MTRSLLVNILMTFCLGYRKYNGNIFLTGFVTRQQAILAIVWMVVLLVGLLIRVLPIMLLVILICWSIFILLRIVLLGYQMVSRFVSTMKGDVKLCSQLTDDMSYVLLFTKTFCIIQDLYLRTLIGVGERRDELYYFRDFSRIGALNIDGVSFSDMWHQRLVHPS